LESNTCSPWRSAPLSSSSHATTVTNCTVYHHRRRDLLLTAIDAGRLLVSSACGLVVISTVYSPQPLLPWSGMPERGLTRPHPPLPRGILRTVPSCGVASQQPASRSSGQPWLAGARAAAAAMHGWAMHTHGSPSQPSSAIAPNIRFAWRARPGPIDSARQADGSIGRLTSDWGRGSRGRPRLDLGIPVGLSCNRHAAPHRHGTCRTGIAWSKCRRPSARWQRTG
jgi:hypothetical protein